jgi:hypothetical protein
VTTALGPTAGSYTGWRLHELVPDGTEFAWDVKELKFYTVSCDNITDNNELEIDVNTVVSSGNLIDEINDSYKPANAFDDNQNSIWGGRPHPFGAMFLGYEDEGGLQAHIKCIMIQHLAQNFPTQMTVQAKPTNGSWNDLYGITNVGPGVNLFDLEVLPEVGQVGGGTYAMKKRNCSIVILPKQKLTPSSCYADPHIKPFEAPPFSFHGQYDGVMMASKEFADGLGIDVHIRTTRVDNPHMSYSYISGTAVKIGTDILEVQDDGSIIVNGEEDEFLLEDEAETAGTTFAGYPITKTMKGTKRNIFVYDLALDVDGGDKSIEIRVNLKTGMIFVDVSGSFPEDTVGLLGSPHHDALLARDGKTDLTGDWNTFGEEWQVQSDEPKLFQDKNRVPQHPAGCIYESQQVKSNLRHRRRLMVDSAGTGSDEEATAVEAAEKACVRATGEKKQFCIDDVMATGDLELAEDSFYN